MQTHGAPSHQRIREAYFALISRQLPALYEFVRRQLAYLESIGDLAPGELTVEDVIPDIQIPTPEDAVESLELKWCVDTAMTGMPRAWRRALRLRHVDGLAEAAIARTIGRSVEETKRILDRARAYPAPAARGVGLSVRWRGWHTGPACLMRS